MVGFEGREAKERKEEQEVTNNNKHDIKEK